MSRVRIVGLGFNHPERNARTLTKRRTAFAHLLMTTVLIVSIVIALTAVAIGTARAETLGALAAGREGLGPLVILIALVLSGVSGIAATLVHRH